MSNPNGNGATPLQVTSPEKPVGEIQDMQSAGEAILRNMLSETKLFANPGPWSGGWCIVELDIDGKKVPNAVLVTSQNNSISTVWMDVESMEEFVRNSFGTLQMLQQAAMASMPLIVANKDQMEQAVQNKKQMDGAFGSKRDQINWPPEGWKK